MTKYILLLILLSGCLGINTTRKLTRDVKDHFTNRLEGVSTSLSDKVDLKGYYRYWVNEEAAGNAELSADGDTLFRDIIFYEDGSCITNLLIKYPFLTYDDYFTDVIAKGKKDLFYKRNWAIYSLSGDTIKVQILKHAANFTPWYNWEEWFLIKDRNTLQVIYLEDPGNTNQQYQQKLKTKVKRSSPAKFYPLTVVPPPYAWFKTNSFFWRNEDDWRTYLDTINQK